MSQEYIDVIDRFGQPLGFSKTRAKIHSDGDYHRVIHLWIYNSNHELLLQKRSLKKENHPGCWDISCGGHILALESSINALKRELKEELGITLKEDDLKFITSFNRFQNPKNKEIVDLYLMKEDFQRKDFSFIDKEVIDVKYFPLSMIKQFIEKKPREFVLREEYPIIIQNIEEDK